MVKGPKMFSLFSGSWRFVELAPDRTEVHFRYNFTCRPTLLQPISTWCHRTHAAGALMRLMETWVGR